MKDHISVCICTFHRNEMLERLLHSLRPQETAGLFDFSVVVVDNDAAGPARDTVSRLSAELGLDIVYGIEPEQTIPAARNHALRLARGNYIAIIDDDEFPPQTWLVTLYRAIQTFRVDGALGPVHPFFSGQPRAWLLKGRFCERPVYRTGTLLDWRQTRTGNVLLKRGAFDSHQLRFDLKCRTSGSDRKFFKQAMELGYRFVSVKEAPVYEVVPPERWTRGFYVKRSLLQGLNAHRNFVGEWRGTSRIIAPVRSVAALAGYAVALPLAACMGAHLLTKCLAGGAYHLGWFSSMLGIELVKKRDF
ncbi:MAG: glycosyltransferase family 2 protein [Candidatus Aminicenantales bacterium]|jgi:succinoglycan biosynthesis protein ExoM